MVRKRVMLNDLAREVGVSTSTASRALRNLYGVSPHVRSSVARAAKRLNYVPNQLARSLSLGQTNLIGLVTPPIVIMTPQGHALSRIEMLARGDGKRLVHLNYDRSEGSTLLNTVLEQHWRGMLLFPNTPREETAELARSLRKYGVPMVVMGGTGLEDADCVNVDAAYGIHLLVRHAHERGLRRAAVLGYSGEVGSLSTSPKFHTLEADLSNCGMDLASVASYEEMHSHGPRLYRVAYEAFDGALRQGLKADWVIGANDVIAVAAMNCLCARGYRVPEDIAVSGYDDTEHAQFARPPLTTIRGPLEEMVELAWGMLRRRLESGDMEEPRVVTLLPALVARESTGRAAVSSAVS